MTMVLNELESGALLAKYEIPMAKSRMCISQEEIIKISEEISFPIVMKVLSKDILHKTEAKCVFINIKTLSEAKNTFEKIIRNAELYDGNAKIDGVLIQEMAPKGLEVIIGMKKDAQFGAVILVGSGGIFTEVYKDVSMRLAPIDRMDALEMIKETKLFDIISGARGTRYDIAALADTIVKISRLVSDNENIEELDINPFFLYEDNQGGKGVDALVTLIEH